MGQVLHDIAHGGALILSASMFALLDLCDATVASEMLGPAAPPARARHRYRHP